MFPHQLCAPTSKVSFRMMHKGAMEGSPIAIVKEQAYQAEDTDQQENDCDHQVLLEENYDAHCHTKQKHYDMREDKIRGVIGHMRSP